MIGISLDIPEVACRGGHIIAPGFVSTLPSNGTAASIFADFTTEGGTNQYWTGSTQPAGFAAWLAAMGGSFVRTSSANYFQSGLLVTAGSGAPRFPTTGGGAPTGLRVTPAQTELLLWNRDLTNVAWTATNVTVAKNQTGIDGAASAASSLTATLANGTVLQTLTRSSAARISGVWVKRITGTGTINMTQNGGTTWTAITVTGSYTQIAQVIPLATLANPVIGFQIVTNGDAIAVDFVSHREMPSGANGIPDPIATTVATVTQAGERILFPYTAMSGSVLAYTQNMVDPGGTDSVFGGDATTAGIFIGTSSAVYAMFSSGGGTVFQNTPNPVLANLNKIASAGNGSTRTLVVNNGLAKVSATAYSSGTYSNGAIGGFSTGVTNNMSGDVGRLALWPGTIASSTDMGTLTT